MSTYLDSRVGSAPNVGQYLYRPISNAQIYNLHNQLSMKVFTADVPLYGGQFFMPFTQLNCIKA